MTSNAFQAFLDIPFNPSWKVELQSKVHENLHSKEGPFPSLIGKQLSTLETFWWSTLATRRENIANQAYLIYISLTTVFCTSNEYSHLGGKGANWAWNSFDLGSNIGNCFQMRLGNKPNKQTTPKKYCIFKAQNVG